MSIVEQSSNSESENRKKCHLLFWDNIILFEQLIFLNYSRINI